MYCQAWGEVKSYVNQIYQAPKLNQNKRSLNLLACFEYRDLVGVLQFIIHQWNVKSLKYVKKKAVRESYGIWKVKRTIKNISQTRTVGWTA